MNMNSCNLFLVKKTRHIKQLSNDAMIIAGNKVLKQVLGLRVNYLAHGLN